MKTVQILDKHFAPYLQNARIRVEIATMADAINRDYAEKSPLFIGVLNGSFIFAAELFQLMTIPCEISFVKISSYSGTTSTGQVSNLIGLTDDIKNRDVILLEDIVDTGLTLDKLRKDLLEKEPASLKIAALLYKPNAFKASYPIDYVGFEIPNDFIVGYGLDYNGFGRNYPDIYKIVD